MNQKLIDEFVGSPQAWLKYKDKLSGDALIYFKSLLELGGRAPDFVMAKFLGWERARVSARRQQCVRADLVFPVDTVLNKESGINVFVWGVKR